MTYLFPCMSRLMLIICLLILSLFLHGCSHLECINPGNVITINNEGDPLNCTNGKFDKYRGDNDYDKYLDNIIEGIKSAPVDKATNKKQVMIFVHGGLNSLESGLNRAPLVNIIEKGTSTKQYFPVLIDWDSGLISSYGENLATIRQGKVEPLYGPMTLPFTFLEDVGRSATRFPLAWYHQFATDWTSLTFPNQPYVTDCGNATYDHWMHPEIQSQNALYCALRKDNSETALKVSLDNADNADWKKSAMLGRFLSYWISMPLKYTLVPIIDGLGKPAWDNMVRRTLNMYRTPEEFDLRQEIGKVDEVPEEVEALAKNKIRIKETGALAKFLFKLDAFMKEDQPQNIDNHKNNEIYEVTLVGHSMGTIVLSEFFRSHKNYKCLSASVKQIVYMAAACSIRDLKDAVIPFMQNYNKDAKFYNLSLHPLNDSGEANWQYVDMVPRGSLLEWIDNFLTTPATPLDRTLGKWENIIQATHIIPDDVRPRITIKGFGVGEKSTTGPQTHGQFDDFCSIKDDDNCQNWKFWDPVFWEKDKYPR